MTETINGPTTWSARRWLTMIATIFVGQLMLVVILSAPPRALPYLSAQRTFYNTLTDPGAAQQLASLPWLADPSEFALVRPQGFTGPAWRRFPSIEHQVSEWTEQPRWLSPDPASLASPALILNPPGASSNLLFSLRPSPQYSAPVLSEGLLGAESGLRIEGDLAGRTLVGALALPRWPHVANAPDDTIAPSTIRVAVNRQGIVTSAALISASPLASADQKAADQKALDLARSARFAPQKTQEGVPDLTWGMLVFQWVGVDPGAPAAVPPAR